MQTSTGILRYTNHKLSADEGCKGQKRVNVSTDKNLAKRGRGRPKKGTVFKNNFGGNLLCTEIVTDNCTALEISPLSTNGQKNILTNAIWGVY